MDKPFDPVIRPATRVNKISQPLEQPNTELLIVKTIQGLLHVITNNLEKLPNESLRRMALDDVGIFEAGVLYKLQEKYA